MNIFAWIGANSFPQLTNPNSVGQTEALFYRVVSSLFDTLGDTLTSPALDTLRREVTAWTNASNPNVGPSPAQIFQLYYTGRVGRNELAMMLSWHGIAMATPTRNSRIRDTWNSLLNLNHPRIDVSAAQQMWRQGLIDLDNLRQRWLITGLHTDDMALLERQVSTLPLAATITAKFLEQPPGYPVDEQIALAGYGREPFRTLVTQLVAPFSPSDAVAMNWRGLLGDADRDRHLRAGGLTLDDWREAWIQGQRPIPGPGALIGMAGRATWDNATAALYGYDDAMPAQFVAWMKAQGYDYSAQAGAGAFGAGGDVTWTQAFWRSSRQEMTVGQALDAYRRLRPERIERYRDAAPGVRPFGQNDLRHTLIVNQYPAAYQDWLTALSYAPIGLRHLRLLHDSGAADRAWAIEQLRDVGYLPEDAAKIVDAWERAALTKLGAGVQRIVDGTPAAIVREIIAGYTDGIIDRQTALERLNQLGLHTAEWSRRLDLADSQKLRRATRDYLRMLRSDYLQGSMSAAELGQRLQATGLAAAGAAYYARVWTAQLTTKRRMLTTGQILAAMKEGIIDPQTAAARLKNLQWVDGDVLVLVAGIGQKIASAAAKALQAQGAARAKAAKTLAAQVKAAQSLARQALQALRRTYPKSEIKRWLKEGIVTPAWARAMLARQQYPADYVEGFILDAGYTKPAKPSAKAQATGAPASPVEGAAPSAPGQ